MIIQDVKSNIKEDNISVLTKYSQNSNKFHNDLEYFLDDIVEISVENSLKYYCKSRINKLINSYILKKIFDKKEIFSVFNVSKLKEYNLQKRKKNHKYVNALFQNEKHEIKCQESIKIDLFLKNIFLDVSRVVYNHNLRFLKNVMTIQRFFSKLKENKKKSCHN